MGSPQPALTLGGSNKKDSPLGSSSGVHWGWLDRPVAAGGPVLGLGHFDAMGHAVCITLATHITDPEVPAGTWAETMGGKHCMTTYDFFMSIVTHKLHCEAEMKATPKRGGGANIVPARGVGKCTLLSPTITRRGPS